MTGSRLFRLAPKAPAAWRTSAAMHYALVAREQLVAPKPATRLLLEIHVGKGLPVGVPHHKAAIQFPTDQGGGKLRSGMARS